MTTIPLLIMAGTVAAAGYLVFKFLLKLYRKPVLAIDLSPIDQPKWSDPKKIDELTEAFLCNGFEKAGDYRCGQLPSLILSGFVRPSEQTAGVIYDHPTCGIWVDCYVEYEDGGSLTVSNAPAGQEMDPMPQRTKIYSRETAVDALLKKLRAEARHGERVTITKEVFSSHVEDTYQKEMKWRLERGGPSSLEVLRVANTLGQSLDSEQLQEATQKIDGAWMKDNGKLKAKKRGPYPFDLPQEFQRPDTFRMKLEQTSDPVPRLNVQALPVYLVLIAALISWCYHGYHYNEEHYPVSLTALMVFFSVLIVLVLLFLGFYDYHRRVRLCPVLKRLADLRPGAFLVIRGSSPSLFYGREKWLGRLVFGEGGEHERASTRLDAVTWKPLGSLTISRSTLLGKVFGRSEEEVLPLTESEFSRAFTVSATDIRLARELLAPAVSEALLRLQEIGRPLVEVDGSRVSIYIECDLSRPRKEATLGRFLEEAEGILETVVQKAGQR